VRADAGPRGGVRTEKARFKALIAGERDPVALAELAKGKLRPKIPAGAGTRLTVVETGFAQLPEDAYRKAYDGNTRGWASELGELAGYLDAA
jgi:hypothetical protein